MSSSVRHRCPCWGVKKGFPFHLARPTLILWLLLAASPAFAEQVKEGAKFGMEGLERDHSQDRLVAANHPAGRRKYDFYEMGNRWSGRFYYRFFDKQLRVTENGNWVYAPGNCRVGIPAVLEVGKSQKFDIEATVTDVKASTKSDVRMRCTSKVVGTDTRVVD
jgi:hypothetical protein